MARQLTFFRYPTPVGPVTIAASEAGVAGLSFGGEGPAGAREHPSAISNQAATELLEYLAGKRRAFDVPLDLEGSDFQLQVWQAVRDVPYGEGRTSSDIARAIGSPGSHRSVGAAVKRNPVAVAVPVHRIVRADGSPLGTGTAADRQAKLLAFERLHRG